MSFGLTVLATFVALGCGTPTQPLGQAELGTGTTSFEPLVAEQEFGVIAGPQGGFHFIIHARIRELEPGDPLLPGDPGNPRTLFGAYDVNGERLDPAFAPYRLGYVQAQGGWYELASGHILVIDNSHVPGIYGQRVRITVDVTDRDGRSARDERWIRAVESIF